MTAKPHLQQPEQAWSISQRQPSRVLEHTARWRSSRVLLSLFVVLLHALACVYYASVAALHMYIRNEPKAIGVLDVVGHDLLNYFDYVVVASVALVAVHGLAICIKRSVRIKDITTNVAHRIHHPAQSATVACCSCWRRVLDTLARWDCAIERWCGVDSYELLVVVEIGLQTFQAYKLSCLVATVWINRLVVAVIVVNCWFMPAVSVAFRKKPPVFVKVVHLALDAVLEVTYGMVVPLTIFYPYYRDADRIFHDSPWLGYYDDTWSINTVAENRQIYVTSWLDFCSKVAPGVSLFVRLFALQSQCKTYEVRLEAASLVKIVPETTDATVHPAPPRRTKQLFLRGMTLWGLAVLAFHIAAASVSMSGRKHSCLLEMRPLGSFQYTCAVLEVSCTQKRMSGSRRELDDALQNVDPLRVHGLIFSHCDALAMPSRLKTFRALVSIKIHNCTLAEWSDDAALTALDHPAMQILYITRTNMGEIPIGLLSRDFPQRLRDIEFCGTNLTALPVDLFETWRHMYYFALELSPGITTFPLALLRADTSIPWLTLSANAITTLPDDLFAIHKYRFFHVAGNPLRRLPAQVGSAASTRLMSIAHTEIAELPASWTTSDANAPRERAGPDHRLVLTADHSPVCGERATTGASDKVSDATTAELHVSWLELQCARNSAPYYYPLEHETQWRQANRE